MRIPPPLANRALLVYLEALHAELSQQGVVGGFTLRWQYGATGPPKVTVQQCSREFVLDPKDNLV